MLDFVKQASPKAKDSGQALLADVRKHAEGRPQNDDITIMAFRPRRLNDATCRDRRPLSDFRQ